MTTLDLRGASTTIRGTAGADLSVSITFTDSAGDPVDVSGYTAAADVLRGSTVVDSFASAVSGAGSNVLTLTLTDAETLAIGSERRLRWRLSMTAGGVTEQWISGGFELSPFGEPAASNTTSLSVQVSGAITATVQTPLPLATLDGRYLLPDGGTTGQALVKASGDDRDVEWGTVSGGDGAVDSVNGATGAVVLDADDIDDTSTTNKFATAAELSKLAGIEAGATADQSAAEILSALLTVDGTGSELDADTLDGNEAADFAAAEHDHASDYVALTTLSTSGKGVVEHGATAGTARPSGFASIEWIGSVEPTNAVDGDTWIDTA